MVIAILVGEGCFVSEQAAFEEASGPRLPHRYGAMGLVVARLHHYLWMAGRGLAPQSWHFWQAPSKEALYFSFSYLSESDLSASGGSRTQSRQSFPSDAKKASLLQICQLRSWEVCPQRQAGHPTWQPASPLVLQYEHPSSQGP
jgi:hypothetical protein